MQEMLLTVIQAVIVAVIPIVSAYLVKFLNAKSAQASEAVKSELLSRYILEIEIAVCDAVSCVSQTYVDKMKEKEQWTDVEHRIAFDKAVKLAKSMLSESATKFIMDAYGDLYSYIGTKVEAEVKQTE